MTRPGATLPALALAALVLLAAHPAIAQEVPLEGFTPEEEAFLAARGPIRIVMTDFAPWLFPDELGQPAGISFDIVRLMRVKTGLQFETVLARNLTAGLAAMRAGEADAWAVISPAPGRDDLLLLEPYALTGIQAWGPEASVPLAATEFAGARVAVVRNSTQAALLATRYPDAIPMAVATQADALAAIEQGDADAWLGLQATILYVARSGTVADIVPLTPVLTEQTMHMAVRRDDAILGGILAKALARVDREELSAIFLRWTGQDLGILAPAPATVPLRIVGYGAVALVVLAVAVGAPVWIATLSRRVARKTAEVRALNDDLETRVAERTRELDAANRELEGFAYNLSHDLRSPLRAIDGFSRSVLDDAGDRLPPASREDLARVRAATQRMGILIDEVLALSRIGRAPLRLENVDVTAKAADILQHLREADPRRDVEVRVQPGMRAYADRVLLRAALSSLLENAWKFTAQRGRAHIEVSTRATPRGEAICVRDDGVGFDPEFAGKLFTPFQRLHSEAEFRGSGVGLALAKRIVERHGGEIWGEGKPGEGATFFLTIPDRAGPRSTP